MPEHALCCIQYTARYLQNNAHAGLLCRTRAVAVVREEEGMEIVMGFKIHRIHDNCSNICNKFSKFRIILNRKLSDNLESVLNIVFQKYIHFFYNT